MISYDQGEWGFAFLFRCSGSVIPKAMTCTMPSVAIGVVMFHFRDYLGYAKDVTASEAMMAVASFVSILGFMLVFRSNQAYNRYWQSSDMIQQARGCWLSAVSNSYAFCTDDPTRAVEVREFRHHLGRLMSLLYATSLSAVSGSTFDYEILDLEGFDQVALNKLAVKEANEDKQKLILHWVENLIIKQMQSEIITAPAPIVGRIFAELAAGSTKASLFAKVKEVPFPFHYAQMLSAMLILYSVGCPLMVVYLLQAYWSVAGTTLLNVGVLWCLNYLAIEIEAPFGNDANDLPMMMEMKRMNRTLMTLLQEDATTPPDYSLQRCTEPGNVSISGMGILSLADMASEQRRHKIKGLMKAGAMLSGKAEGKATVVGGGSIQKVGREAPEAERSRGETREVDMEASRGGADDGFGGRGGAGAGAGACADGGAGSGAAKFAAASATKQAFALRTNGHGGTAHDRSRAPQPPEVSGPPHAGAPTAPLMRAQDPHLLSPAAHPGAVAEATGGQLAAHAAKETLVVARVRGADASFSAPSSAKAAPEGGAAAPLFAASGASSATGTASRQVHPAFDASPMLMPPAGPLGDFGSRDRIAGAQRSLSPAAALGWS